MTILNIKEKFTVEAPHVTVNRLFIYTSLRGSDAFLASIGRFQLKIGTYSAYIMLCLNHLNTFLWRHNGRDGVLNHQPHDCYSTVNSGADQTKHQRSASLAFRREIHRWPVNSPHKWPVTPKMFPFDNVIMNLQHKEPSIPMLLSIECQDANLLQIWRFRHSHVIDYHVDKPKLRIAEFSMAQSGSNAIESQETTTHPT